MLNGSVRFSIPGMLNFLILISESSVLLLLLGLIVNFVAKVAKELC